MSGNIMIVVLILMITSVWNDFLVGADLRRHGRPADDRDPGQHRHHERGVVHYNVDMAAALLTAIPPLVVYFGLGKFFVQGITAGAIKG